jgi:enoyl-CoA hydratase/carnithine racemase
VPDTDPRVTVRIDGGVADVRLNRPDKLNAMDLALATALVETGEALAADRSVRAVVLSGEGRGFCAGLDLAAFSATPPSGGAARGSGLAERRPGRDVNLAQLASRVWSELPVPVIAAVHGVAVGAGLQIALGADLRFVAPDVRLSVLEIRWGLIPDMTGTWVLPRLVGLDVAQELTWTGRMVDGEEAVRIGLATQLAADPRAAALELAAQIAAKSPDAVRAAKRLLRGSLDTAPKEQFLAESEAMAALVGSPNQREAVAAYFEKRPPDFADPA